MLTSTGQTGQMTMQRLALPQMALGRNHYDVVVASQLVVIDCLDLP